MFFFFLPKISSEYVVLHYCILGAQTNLRRRSRHRCVVAGNIFSQVLFAYAGVFEQYYAWASVPVD